SGLGECRSVNESLASVGYPGTALVRVEARRANVERAARESARAHELALERRLLHLWHAQLQPHERRTCSSRVGPGVGRPTVLRAPSDTGSLVVGAALTVTPLRTSLRRQLRLTTVEHAQVV